MSNKLLLLERNSAKSPWTPHKSEPEVQKRMRGYGIPTELGKNTSFHYVDLVAWGGVILDVKESHQDKSGRFKFRLRSNRKNLFIRCHLYVFVCRYITHTTYHVFPNDHEVFYRTDGEMKRAVSFHPYKTGHAARADDYGKSLTRGLMDLHKDAWYYVEVERKALSQRLIAEGAVALPKAA